MKFKELFTSADGIFNVFEQSFPTDFETLFGEQTAQALNSFALGLYGNKTLFDYITADSYPDFVKIAISQRLQGWTRTNSALLAQYDVTTGEKTEHTKTGTEGVSVNDNNETLTANKPFNNENFDDGQRQTRTGQKSEDRTYNLTDNTTRSLGGESANKSLQKEIEIRRYNLQRQIMSDIVAEITLSVYD